MRIAYLVHYYPPFPCGGAGYYTASIAEAFVERGEDVSVLCVDEWGQGNEYINGIKDESINGVDVRRIFVNWKKAPRPFDWLYDSPVLGELAGNFLRDYTPHVVHFSSAYTLSIRPAIVAKQMKLPVVMHLHDYWTICPQITLLHRNGTICSGPQSAWKCQKCLLDGSKFWSILSKTRQDQLNRVLVTAASKVDWLTRIHGLRGMLGDLQQRKSTILAALSSMDCLIVPTQFAKQYLEKFGVPSNNMVVMPYGNRIDWAREITRQKTGNFRIGFLGNVTPIKGVHLLIEAYKELKDCYPEISLEIWGDTTLDLEYYEKLQGTTPDEVYWGGRYSKVDLPRILGSLDVVVVPSIWYETQGIVIQEAFAAGVPVIVSNNTSLTETVVNEEDGLYFAVGSPKDLARKLERLLTEQGLLERLQKGIKPVRELASDIEELDHIYNALAA